MSTRRIASAAVLLAATVTLAACGSSAPASTAASPAHSMHNATPNSASQAPGIPLSITDPWVKAAKKGMTSAFGTLVNSTDADITVVAGSSPASAKIELHEVVDSGGKTIMRPKDGGFVVPAHGTHQLQPGGDHIMLMDVTKEVKPGEPVSLTLTLADGTKLEFTAVAKDFAGAKEDYQPGMDGKDHNMDGMDGMGKS